MRGSEGGDGRGFGSPSILKHVPLQGYDPAGRPHMHLSELSMLARRLPASGEPEDLEALVEVEDQVDQAAAELWGLTDAELREIRRSLEELG